jgi:carboxymethylenebutenolidase
VVVIQEWWGLVPHIESVCDRLANAGYVALAPDLYRGETASAPDVAKKLSMALKVDQVCLDVQHAVSHLLSLPEVKKVGVVGFCMGGMLALHAACEDVRISACVDFYGAPSSVTPRLGNLRAAFLGMFGENDHVSTPQSAADLERQLKGLGKDAEIVIYPGAEHAFFNDTRPAVFNMSAAAEAWKRTLSFFETRLS